MGDQRETNIDQVTIFYSKMKFVGVLASASLVFNGINASLASMEKGFKQLQEMTGNNRNLMVSSISSLNKYGCWCYFDDAVGKGKGLPKDFIDEECRATKILRMCHRRNSWLCTLSS